MEYSFAAVLDHLGNRQDLTDEMARAGFDLLMDGAATPAQAGAFLLGLRTKGETPRELAAGVRAALTRARLVKGLEGKRIDTCGTGGDGKSSFNCSTAVALLLAGMGHTVVKHGNRAVSSSCGSADALEALGVTLKDDPAAVAPALNTGNFAFLFAPFFHPAFKHIMPVRKELGVRTLFNLMGPLLNPARPTHQLLGVPRPGILGLMAETLLLTGVERAVVVHGAGGYDELTPFGANMAVWIENGSMAEGVLDSRELGFAEHKPEDVAVADKESAVAVLRELLVGRGPRAMQDMICLNLAVCLHLLDSEPLPACVDRARTALADGVGMRAVERANA